LTTRGRHDSSTISISHEAALNSKLKIFHPVLAFAQGPSAILFVNKRIEIQEQREAILDLQTESDMQHEELASKLAERNRVSRAEARDQVDELVRKIVASLRNGTPAEFPGAGRLVVRRPRKGGNR